MKKFLAAFVFLMAAGMAQAEPLNKDSNVVIEVLTNPQNIECVKQLGEYRLVNVEADYVQYRCPGCNKLTITGAPLSIDVPEGKVTASFSSRGTFSMGQLVKTWTCSVEVEN